jgi:hypothetical protein
MLARRGGSRIRKLAAIRALAYFLGLGRVAMTEVINSLDLGSKPEAAGSGAVLLQSEVSTTLICNAVRKVGGAWVAVDARCAVRGERPFSRTTQRCRSGGH